MAEQLNLTTFCRCCHKNGIFKSLFSDYIYNENEIENYSQMLRDTFGISFEPSERDKMHTICDGCIELLRISTDLKIGVLACGKNIKREPLIENDVTVKIEKMCSYAYSVKEVPLVADDTEVKKEETENDEVSRSGIDEVLDEECNQYVKVEVEVGNESDESSWECGVSLRNINDIDEKKCNICNKTFKHKGHLENHVRTHEGYTCEICLEILSNKREHSKHIKSKHVVDGKYCCIDCDATFLEVKKLKCHIKMHFKHRCEMCNKVYKSKHGLRNHEKAHKDEGKFVCAICNRRFTRSEKLKAHMRKHTGGKLYKCQECERKFTRNGNLVRHSQNIHVDVKKYSCQYCDKEFMVKYRLVAHEMIHTGVKPYECDKCKKSFTRKFNLVRHNKVHERPKPDNCSLSENILERKENLNGQIFTQANINVCDICKMTFRYMHNLRQHMLAVHLGSKSKHTASVIKGDMCKETCKRSLSATYTRRR